MKKIIVLVLLVGIGFGAYKFLFKSQVATSEENQINFKNATGVEVTDYKSEEEVKKINESSANSDKDVEEKMQQLDAEYDRIEKEWNNLVQVLFVQELSLSEEVYSDYTKMREGLGRDKIRAFEAFHKEMEAKYGPNYTYNPSDEELQFERDIQKRYDDLLRSKIGDQNFTKYLELRDNFNNNLMEKQDPEKGVILMDF